MASKVYVVEYGRVGGFSAQDVYDDYDDAAEAYREVEPQSDDPDEWATLTVVEQ